MTTKLQGDGWNDLKALVDGGKLPKPIKVDTIKGEITYQFDQTKDKSHKWVVVCKYTVSGLDNVTFTKIGITNTKDNKGVALPTSSDDESFKLFEKDARTKILEKVNGPSDAGGKDKYKYIMAHDGDFGDTFDEQSGIYIDQRYHHNYHDNYMHGISYMDNNYNNYIDSKLLLVEIFIILGIIGCICVVFAFIISFIFSYFIGRKFVDKSNEPQKGYDSVNQV